jgi:hypothetical protein
MFSAAFVVFVGSSAAAQNPPEDLSTPLSLLLAAQGGGHWPSSRAPGASAYGGIKIGGPGFALDLGYDRVASRNAFSMQIAAMLAVVRFPGPQSDTDKNFVRIYFLPGYGYRAGGGFGAYGTAKILIAFFSDRRLTSSTGGPSPYVEIERRFPFGSTRGGDTRFMFGLMLASCPHCGEG